MAIIKIELIEGNADINYTNHYSQMILAALELEHVKLPARIDKCLIVHPGESILIDSKYLYLAIPDKPKFTQLEDGHVKKMWQSGEAMMRNPIKIPGLTDCISCGRRCRVCGCTDNNACLDPNSQEVCHWVSDDLCSVCDAAMEHIGDDE